MNSSAYPNAPAEERSRVKNTQKRIYSIVGAMCVCFLLILVGILVPTLLLQQKDARLRQAAQELESEVAEYWTGVFRNAVVSTITVCYTLSGFILGSLQTLPPINGTPEERVAGQNFSRFHLLARHLNSSMHDLALIVTAPGGVVYQTAPDTPSLYMYDMMYNYTYPMLGMPNLTDMRHEGSVEILGPHLRNVTQPFFTGFRWDIDVIQPVYNTTPDLDVGPANFWGFSYAVLSLTALVEERGLEADMAKDGLEFLMYTLGNMEDNDDGGIIVPVYTTLPNNSTQEFLRAFTASGESRNVLSSKMEWTITVHKSISVTYYSEKNVAIIVATAVGGSLTLLLVAVIVILIHTREYDGRRHAPRSAPFAIVTIGPCHGSELWNLASEQMIEVTEKLGDVLKKAMVESRAYPITQLHPFTNSYITRTVSGAVHMAFAVLEELQSHPIDMNLCRLLGDDGKLLVSCTVHWCTDATVTIEPSGGNYRFEGFDVMFGGRMWFFGAPNTVTLSSAANEARGPELSGMKVELLNSVYLRGVAQLQKLYTLTDPSSKRLREAAAVAAIRTARIREQQQQRRLAEDSTGTGPGTSTAVDGSTGSGHGDSASYPLANSGDRVAGSANFLRTPITTTLSSSTTTGYIEVAPSATNSVPTAALGPVRAEGRPMLRRPRRRQAAVARADPNAGLELSAPASTTSSLSSSTSSVNSDSTAGDAEGNPLTSFAPPLSSNRVYQHQGHWQPGRVGLSAPSPVTRSGGRPRFPSSTIVPPSSAVAAIAGAGSGVMADSFASSSSVSVPTSSGRGSGGAMYDGGPFALAPTSTGSRRSSAGHEGIRRELSVVVDSPLLVTDATNTGGCEYRPAVGEGEGQPMTLVTMSAPRTPINAAPSSTASFAKAAHGGSAFAASATVLPTRYLGRFASGSVGNPLHIDVPVANSLAVPRDSPAVTTTCSSSVGTPAGASHHSFARGNSVSAVQTPRSCVDGGTSSAALYTSLYDNGPLGDRRFPASPSLSASESASHPLSVAAAAASVSMTTDSVDRETGDCAAIAHSLLHPSLPVWLDTTLRGAYEHQAFDVDISYDSVRVVVYYFFSSYKTLFRPLTAQERVNVYKRLMGAFGVPQQGILEHLAACCTLIYLKFHEEVKTLLMDPAPLPVSEVKKAKKKR